uniref:Uncharacterized protein n=1 Tax=Tanacetum cinerariifolium TaxID=118510 RepID=A0A6L2KBI7_TANCI|nr:hypothetical protein [Tanacetum cinerariifolium]
MDPNSSLKKICLGDDVVVISSDKVEGPGDWNSFEYQDTASSKGKKFINALSFYRLETDKISEQYIAPCFVNGFEAYDGEVNLEFDENLISNEFMVKLCLDYEVKKGKKLVKKELIVALKGELYFVKFIINPKEDDFEPKVILGRSFLRLAHGVVDFGKVNENAFTNTRLDINTMPYQIYETLERDEMNKIDRGITMINHTQAEAMGRLSDVLCQVGVTTIIAKFLIMDIPIDCDAPIVVGRGFLYMIAESDSDDEEEYVIKRNKVREAESNEEIFTSVAWIRAFNINDPIYAKLCHEFYSTYEFDEVCADDELQSKKIIKFRLGGRGLRNDDNFNAQVYWLSISREDNLGLSRSHTSTIRNPILRVIHKMISYGLCQRTSGYDKVQKNDLWLLSMILDTKMGAPRVGIPGPPRASMHDLYDRMEIRQDAIERMEYRQSYHWDRIKEEKA